MGVAKYPINYDFFDSDSEELWYFIGLVANDGYISDDRVELCLNNKDEHILAKLRDLICPDKPLYHKRSTHATKFTIHSRNVAARLKAVLSMQSNNKHCEMRLPFIPRQYAKDFVRGIIDGDGCIDTTKAYRDGRVYIGPRLRILGGREFLTQLMELIRDFEPNNTRSVAKKGAENVWCITYNFRIAEAVLRWCYESNSICLFRKYNRFKEVSDMKK